MRRPGRGPELNSGETNYIVTEPGREVPLSRPGAGGVSSGDMGAQLGEIGFRDQKTQEGRRLPHYLIRNSGVQMEAIIQRVVARIRGAASGRRAVIGWARGFGNVAHQNRPLRIVEELAKGHAACADIHFRVQDRDLYVRFQAASNTRIFYLKWATALCTWVLVGPLLLSFYLKVGGAFDSWINEYAQKTNDFHHAGQDRKLFYVTKIKKGASIVDGKKLIENLGKTRMVELSSPNVFAGGLTVPELKTQADANGWAAGSSFFAGMSAMMGSAETFGNMVGSSIDKGGDDPKSGEPSLPKLSDLQYCLPVAQEVVSHWISGSRYRAEVLAEEIVEVLAAQHTNVESVALYDIDSKYVRKEPITQMEQPWQSLKRFEYLDTLPVSDLLRKIFKPSSVGEIQSAFEAATTKEGPWSVLRLFLADPKGGVFHVGPAALVITVMIGGLFWFLPKHYLNGMCRFLGWPTQDEFENHALAMPARIEGILSDVLLYDFGVQQKDIININPGAPT